MLDLYYFYVCKNGGLQNNVLLLSMHVIKYPQVGLQLF